RGPDQARHSGGAKGRATDCGDAAGWHHNFRRAAVASDARPERRVDQSGQVEQARDKMKIKLKYIYRDPDRHGNERFYVRHQGRRIRIRETPNTPAFMLACSAAIEAC